MCVNTGRTTQSTPPYNDLAEIPPSAMQGPYRSYTTRLQHRDRRTRVGDPHRQYGAIRYAHGDGNALPKHLSRCINCLSLQY